ncbi:MAG: hypothetical protein J7M05_08285 [Anaerolineae bacterium]|nr:hypothetical protein [Anaerolineae bacterium]
MPKNPQKKRCQVPGCRAWAQHGYDFCSAHLRSRALRHYGQLILPLLRAAAQRTQELPDDLELIEQELQQLMEARTFFLEWVKALSQMEEKPTMDPARFLRAWNDSTARVIQLLRARREFSSGGESALVQALEEAAEEVLAQEGGEPRGALPAGEL